MHIAEVTTSAQAREFIEFPVRLYKNDPNYIHPLDQDVELIFDPAKNKLSGGRRSSLSITNLRGTVQTMFGVVFGVVPEHQRRGVEAALVYATAQLLQQPGAVPYKQTVMNWIGDFNPKMMAVAELVGSRPWRTHETLRYLFDRTLEFQCHPVID